MKEDPIPDYGHGYYKTQTINRKRRVIDQTLDQLHDMQMQMIEDALAVSDMRLAKTLIKHIMERT